MLVQAALFKHNGFLEVPCSFAVGGFVSSCGFTSLSLLSW
jgi:hypothetical protein